MMRFSFYSLALAACASAFKEENGVIIATTKNFEEIINKHITLVEFYAPWCGHCKSLLPEFEKAAQTLKESGKKARLAKIDCTVETALATKYDVTGYPQIKLFKKGNTKAIDASAAGRDHDSIIKFMKKSTAAAAPEIKEKDEGDKSLESLIEKHATGTQGALIVGFFADLGGSFAKIYKSIADDMREKNKNFRTAKLDIGGVDKDTVRIYRTFDGGNVDYSGKEDLEELQSWINGEAYPLVIEFTKEESNRIGADGKYIFAIAPKTDEEEHEESMQYITAAAKRLKGKGDHKFFFADSSEFQGTMKMFNLASEDLPRVAILETIKGADADKGEKGLKRYIGAEFESYDFEEDTIVQFVEDFYAGKVPVTLGSERLNKGWDSKEHAVKHVVQHVYHETTRNPKRAVFMFLYGPNCQHCKEAWVPVWKEFAEAYKGRNDIWIGATDAQANELELVPDQIDKLEIMVTGTFLLYPKGAGKNEKPIPYTGERDIEELTAFVDEHANVKKTKKEEKKEKEEVEEEIDTDEL